MTRYIAHYGYQTGQHNTVEVPSIQEIKQGFWLNKAMEFTQGEDARFWIPISSVAFVEKIHD